MNSYIGNFPSQKTPKSKKTPKWFRECIDAVDSSGYFHDEGVRTSYQDKILNSNLYNGKLDIYDLEKTINPNGIETNTISYDIQHYPIINPRIDLLVGEESNREFKFSATVSNPDAISEKEKELASMVRQNVLELIESDLNKEQLEAEVKKLKRKVKNFQSQREKTINALLTHHSKKQKFENLFNNGFKTSLIQGEEYYEAAIIGGEPRLLKVDPLKVFWVRSGYSNKIEDSDLIILNDYWSPGQIIDYYHDDLKDKHLKQLEKGFGSSGNDPFVDKHQRDRKFLANVNFLDSATDPDKIEDLINIGESNGYTLLDSYDESGNVRVLRVYWRGWRRVKKVTFFDKNGYEKIDYFPEDYIVKEDEGETFKYIWINEWYEGTKIGNDIYLRLKPKELQFRSLDNPAKSHPGIVGKTYSFNSFRTVSMIGTVKNYLYLYDAIHDRLNKLLANNHGKVLEMDFATIPEKWDVEKWFHYLNKMKIAVKDSFKEGNKGSATGKLAGSLNNATKGYLDLDQGANIQQHIGLLEFIKSELTEITGVSEQRLGNVSNRETLGGIERSVVQSNHVTEWRFSEHDEVKIDALRAFIQACKIAYKGRTEKLQYVLDEASTQTLNLIGDDINEADYDIIIENSKKTEALKQKIEGLAEVALNAGNAQFKDVLNIYFSNSLSDMKNKIEDAEEETAAKAQQAQEKELELQKQQIEREENNKQADRELENIKNMRDNQTKIITSGTSETEASKIELERQKRLDELKKFNDKLQQDNKHHNDKMNLEKKKINTKSQIK